MTRLCLPSPTVSHSVSSIQRRHDALSAHHEGDFGSLVSHLKALLILKRKVCKYELVVKG